MKVHMSSLVLLVAMQASAMEHKKREPVSSSFIGEREAHPLYVNVTRPHRKYAGKTAPLAIPGAEKPINASKRAASFQVFHIGTPLEAELARAALLRMYGSV